MTAILCLLAAVVTAQVPPPDASARQHERLRHDRDAALTRERDTLIRLADALDAGGKRDASAEVRKLLPPKPAADGSALFAGVPEVVPGRGPALANVRPDAPASPKAEADAIRAETAKALFDLAARAASAKPPRYALADECLRGVIARQPDHAEARRLLGQVPYEGGWATPFAVSEFKKGKVPHPVYGWVRKSWVPHLEKGELPLNGGAKDGQEGWIPADQANARHADWDHAWVIRTEHFQIKTNVPLDESIAFGRHLEAFQELFQSLCADVIGESLPLAQRYKSKTMTGEKTAPPHDVDYYLDRATYIDRLRASQPDIELSLGIYLPPSSPGKKRGRAYFFLDKGGELPVLANMFHEVSHQLLFESGIARPDDFTRNAGNYWVFEGFGTYFETVAIGPDGALRYGGLVGPRNRVARKTLTPDGALIPVGTLTQYDEEAFKRGDAIYRRYQEASALATFLMHGHDARYRDGFLAYVRDACKGALRHGSGHSLEERLGVPYATLDREFLAYLKADVPEESPR